MTGPAADAARRQAVAWEVQLRDGALDAAGLHAFERWRGACDANSHAWEALQQRLAALGGRSRRTDPGADAAMAGALRAPSDDRRRALRAAFGLLVVGVGGWGARTGYHALGFDADWRSGVGQRGQARLADGTAMAYDADSRIYLSGIAAAPVLRLQQGQLLLAGATGRPLTVHTAHGMVQASGAAFNVGRLRARSVVSVRSGTVLVQPAGAAVPAVQLGAGQTCYFDGDGARASDLSFAAASGWTRGVHVADRVPLAELLDVFGRYRAGIVRASGPAAARLVSGVFRLHDIDAALLQLADAFPVTISRYGRYLTVLH